MTGDATKLLEAAMAAHRRGDEAAAGAGYREVLAHQPRNPDALHLLGVIVARTARDEGIALITRALAVNPDSVEAHFNLGNILAGASRMAEAEPHFRHAYLQGAKTAAAANGLGGALLQLGRYGEAEPYLREALARDPAFAPALINMGILLEATGRIDDALQVQGRVLALYPDHDEAHLHRALTLLARGQFRDGWAEYAWRVKSSPTFYGRFNYPYWRGEPLAGRKILVWTELGPGDECLAATMLPDLIAAGAKVVLLCSPRMAPIFARSFPSIAVIPAGQNPSDRSVTDGIAFQASVGDLGASLRTTFDDFSARRAVLKADDNHTAALRHRYKNAATDNLVVGISWRSKNTPAGDVKSVPLTAWGPVLRTPGVTFVSLQYGDVTAEIAQARREFGVEIIVDPQIDPLANLDHFAAQVAAMDGVISISNTTLHFAGALGRPVSALVPSNHGRLWYWFLERTDSPWYPSARLFRQDLQAGWRPALAAIADGLRSRHDGAADIFGTFSPSS